MKHGLSKHSLPYLFPALFVLLFLLPCTLKARAAERPSDTDVPPDGCVFLALDGSFETDAQKALDYVNELRYEACTAGDVPDPRNPSRMLTPEDYVPMQWSQGLEKVARIRAAEASVTLEHERLNDRGIFGVYNGIYQSYAECLAWASGYAPTMKTGVMLWYREKADWVGQVPGTVTGHYTSLINPNTTYIGLSSFLCSSTDYYLTVAGAFSSECTISTDPLPAERNVSQLLAVAEHYIDSLALNLEDEVEMSQEISLRVYPTFNASLLNNHKLYVPHVTFTSSNPSVASVNGGTLTGLSEGTTTIRAYQDGELICKKEITVIPYRCRHEYQSTGYGNHTFSTYCPLCGENTTYRFDLFITDSTDEDAVFRLMNADVNIDQNTPVYIKPMVSINGGDYELCPDVFLFFYGSTIDLTSEDGIYTLTPKTPGLVTLEADEISSRWFGYIDTYFLTVCEAGWKYEGGHWSYLHLGEKVKGWKNIDGDWYYFGTDGFMKSDWQRIDGTWYYMDPSNGGRMVTGWKSISGKWYYFNDNGSMATGWVKVDGTWYYIDPSSSTMVTGWKKIDGSWYYFAGSGAMKTGWQNIGGTWYYLNSAMKTGWQKIDGGWYYFTSGGAMVSGWQSIGGTWYYFDPSNASKMTTGWKYMGGWYFFKDSGAMASGWQKVDGIWYYFDPASSSKMVSGKTMVIDGVSYSFAANGAWES